MAAAAVKLLEYLGFIAAVYAIIFLFTFIMLLLEELWKEMKEHKGGRR